MKITLAFLLLALTAYSEGKSFKKEITSSQTRQEDMRLKRSVFGIMPKRRMEKIVIRKEIVNFHDKFVRINQLNQKARHMKMHIQKHLRLRSRGRELCSVMAISLKHLCHKINWNT